MRLTNSTTEIGNVSHGYGAAIRTLYLRSVDKERHRIIFSNEKMRFQSYFMLMTGRQMSLRVAPLFLVEPKPNSHDSHRGANWLAPASRLA